MWGGLPQPVPLTTRKVRVERRAFEAKAAAVGRARYPNVTHLCAYYHETDEKLLPYYRLRRQALASASPVSSPTLTRRRSRRSSAEWRARCVARARLYRWLGAGVHRIGVAVVTQKGNVFALGIMLLEAVTVARVDEERGSAESWRCRHNTSSRRSGCRRRSST
uniref:Uncharacterized protein n=2 Tax=Oryza sativa subsp. japonica TaxID=39947 RepID=Q7Y0A1_ORYSJ|nr:hypothetical protein [Oryza sativa Japonica Group]ABF97978.1 hypothetical protein LOC_Os03g45430 [Oryza sativa Japonica Group]